MSVELSNAVPSVYLAEKLLRDPVPTVLVWGRSDGIKSDLVSHVLKYNYVQVLESAVCHHRYAVGPSKLRA